MNFQYSFGFKRYHTLDYYYKNKYGGKVFKISLDGGFTCPNHDGTKGVGGCTFCSSEGSGEFSGSALLPLSEQFEAVRTTMEKKWKGVGYIAYLQPFTATYCTVERMRTVLDELVALPNVKEISLSTRGDCVSDEMAKLLTQFSNVLPLEVEFGLQSSKEETIEVINRCHTLGEFEEGFSKLDSPNIRRTVHIINGLPGESKEDMLETARYLAKLRPNGIKIHMLHLLKGTAMAKMYNDNPFPLLTLEEYVDVVCSQIELLPPETVIERLTGDGKSDDLIAPLWTTKKFVTINEIDKEFIRRGSCQGSKL